MPQRHAMTVEEFEDLDGHLAAVVKLVPKFGGGELTGWRHCREFDGSFHHLTYRTAKEEMIARHFIDLAKTAQKLKKPPHIGLRGADFSGNVADARRPISPLSGDQRFHVSPHRFVSGG
jgi:hypothetical protein